LCGGERETWEHVWEECREWREGRESWQEVVKEMLGKEGEGEWWMREVERERERERGLLVGEREKRKEEDEGEGKEGLGGSGKE
jgi:hypothetical protein